MSMSNPITITTRPMPLAPPNSLRAMANAIVVQREEPQARGEA